MELELNRIVRAVRRFWWVALAAAVAFGAIAAGIGALNPKSYTSDTLLLVVPTNELVGNADTIIELATSQRVLGPILVEHGVDQTAEEFASNNVSATNVPGTSLVRIEVSHSDPQVAADITNAIAASVSARSFDVGLGVLQRNLNNLVFERDQINLQLVTVNAQVDQINAQSDQLSSEDQVQLSQLESERLRLEQRISDIEGGIRLAESEVATFVEPVIVNDAAVPAIQSDVVSPVLLGVLGLVLGTLLGAAFMLLMELRDSSVRDEWHLRELTGFDSVTSIDENVLEDAETAGLRILATRTTGTARNAGSASVALISPRSTGAIQLAADTLLQSSHFAGLKVTSSVGLLEDPVVIGDITSDTTALLLVDQGKTASQDVLDVVGILRDLGVPAVTAALLK